MHDCHRACGPTSSPSSPCSILLKYRHAASMLFLLRYIMQAFGTQRSGWKEISRTSVIHDDDYLSGYPDLPAIPATVRTDRSALAAAVYEIVLMCRQMQHRSLTILQP